MNEIKTVRDHRGNVHVFDTADYPAIRAAIEGGELRRSDFVSPPSPAIEMTARELARYASHETAEAAEPRDTEGETPSEQPRN